MQFIGKENEMVMIVFPSLVWYIYLFIDSTYSTSSYVQKMIGHYNVFR